MGGHWRVILSLGHEAPPCTYRKLEEKKPLQGSEEIPPSLYCTIHTHMGSQDHLLHRGAWPLCSAVPYTHTHTHTHTHAHTHTHPHTHTHAHTHTHTHNPPAHMRFISTVFKVPRTGSHYESVPLTPRHSEMKNRV